MSEIVKLFANRQQSAAAICLNVTLQTFFSGCLRSCGAQNAVPVRHLCKG